MTLGGGAAFGSSLGVVAGTFVAAVAVFVGASAGAIISFLFGRYLWRDWALSWIDHNSYLQALDLALESKGLKILILLRLSPSIPFNALNYSLGVTAVSFLDYCYSLIGMIPGTFMYVLLGATAGSMFHDNSSDDSADGSTNNTLKLCLLVAGVFLDICAVYFVTKYAKEELDKISKQPAAVDPISNFETSISTSSPYKSSQNESVESETFRNLV